MEQSPKCRWRRLRIEPLEDRRLLATLTVNSAADVTLPGDGLVTLREAISAANANTTTDLGHTAAGADTIFFDPAAFATPQTLALTQGELALTEALTINGPGRTLLTIDGQLQSRIFNITATTGDFTIAGMTLTRGKTTGEGGAIRSLSNLTVADSTITGNLAFGDGGGIYVYRFGSGGGLSVANSTITGNSSITGSGGGIFCRDYLSVASSTISGNTVPDSGAYGGGISTSGPTAVITGSTISGNNGGGSALYFGNSSTLSLQSSTISSNSHRGVYARGYATLTDCTVSGNGGVGAFAYHLSVVNSIVTSDELSGRYDLAVTDSTITTGSLSAYNVALTNSTINGGGINGYTSVTLTDATITGGGITTSVANLHGHITLNNSTVADGLISGRVVRLTNSVSRSIQARGDEEEFVRGNVTLNESSVYGEIGVIFSSVSVTNSTISGNIITSIDRFYPSGPINVTNSTISGSSGFGIRASYCNVTLTNSVVSGHGLGGIYVNGGNVTLDSSLVSDNGGRGIAARAGEYSFQQGNVTLTRSAVSGNNATRTVANLYRGNGGGIHGRTVTLISSTINRNSASGYGGGIYASFSATLTNSTISGNSASTDGGGILASNVTVKYSTVTGNTAVGKGGGVHAGNVITISSSIVAGNTAGVSNPDIRRSAGTLNVSLSLIGDNAGTSLIEAQTLDANGNLIGSSAGGGIIDPRLAPLADNGGRTQTHALLPDSPAIDPALNAVDPEQPTPTHNYQLNGSLSDALGGPSLVALGGTLTATGYQFGPNQGLNLSSALVDPADYSIERAFSWNSLSGGWQKIIDFHNLVTDIGLYTLGNGLQFMNGAFTPNLFSAGVARHLVLTRDDVTNVVRAYIDGVERWNFVDNAGDAVFDGPNDIIRFFQDDTASGQTEAQSGFVDRIRIFDGALTATEVTALFNPPPPPPPGVPPNDQRGAPFARVFNNAIDMGAFELQPPASYGDFNQDRAIDTADYVVYRKFFGTSVPSYTLADSNGDGSVTPSDKDAWRKNFANTLDVTSPGSSPASAGAVNRLAIALEVAPTAAAFDEAMLQPDLFAGTVNAANRDARLSSRPNAMPSFQASVRMLHLLEGSRATSTENKHEHSSNRDGDFAAERDELFADLVLRAVGIVTWSGLSNTPHSSGVAENWG